MATEMGCAADDRVAAVAVVGLLLLRAPTASEAAAKEAEVREAAVAAQKVAVTRVVWRAEEKEAAAEITETAVMAVVATAVAAGTTVTD